MNSVKKKGKEVFKISRWCLFQSRVQQLIEKVKYQVDKGIQAIATVRQETWGGLTSGKGGDGVENKKGK